MDKTTAWKAIKAAFRCGAELQALLPVLKNNCTASEYKKFAVGIAHAIDTINVQLLERALTAHPELKDKIESDLAKSGRIN
jgi:hypothetical protein